jgi:hypothetical protein
MIKRTQQDWSVGSVVKVGFLALTVKAAITTPGDHKPDAYILVNKAGTHLYKFVPHNGIEKIDAFEAREMIADSWVQADRVAAQAIEHAKQSAKAIADINDIIFK